jgi:hypothetical protein
MRTCLLALLVIAGGALFLGTWQYRHRLGAPGVRVISESILGVDDPTQGRGNTNTFIAATNSIYLPERVGDFESTPQPVSKVVLDWLPKDTTYGQRLYKSKDNFQIQANAVLMGKDRTSIHKPEYCLPMQGWAKISEQLTSIPISNPTSYDLPVMRRDSRQTFKGKDGKEQSISSVFIYWFVADSQFTANHRNLMWRIGYDLLRTGVLQRWAYVTFFSVCAPGQEEATYARMREFIAAAVPEFQLTPAPAKQVVTADRSSRPVLRNNTAEGGPEEALE